MPGPDAMTPAQLARLIGTPDAPCILDVRTDADFAAEPFLVPGARRADPFAPGLGLPPGPVVVLCKRGGKLSMGAAALLRLGGRVAEVLEGGTLAWRAAGLPVLTRSDAPALWVTRHRPKIDRIACPWLIRRFLNPEARFLFVAPSAVLEVASRFHATAFDIEGAPHTHDGALCTFDTLLRDFGLMSEPLARMALVIRAADTDRHDLAPQAAGLLALSVGLSRMFRNDLEQLEAGMLIYDALYRWARDGAAETHDWPVTKDPA